MQNFDDMTVIRSKRYLSALYFVVTITLTVICCFGFNIIDNQLDKVFVLLATIFLGFYTISYFYLMLFPKVIFAYNNDKFYIKSYDKFINWSEIADFYTVKIKKTNLIVIHLHNEQNFIDNLSCLKKLLYKDVKWKYGTGVVITLATTGTKVADVLEIFQIKCTNLIKPEENDINT